MRMYYGYENDERVDKFNLYPHSIINKNVISKLSQYVKIARNSKLSEMPMGIVGYPVEQTPQISIDKPDIFLFGLSPSARTLVIDSSDVLQDIPMIESVGSKVSSKRIDLERLLRDGIDAIKFVPSKDPKIVLDDSIFGFSDTDCIFVINKYAITRFENVFAGDTDNDKIYSCLCGRIVGGVDRIDMYCNICGTSAKPRMQIMHDRFSTANDKL